MKTIDLVYFNAGGGHRAAALALQQSIAQQGWPWRVRLVDLNRVLDPQASFRRLLGFDPEQFYNLRLQRGWTLGLAQELKVLQAAIRLAHSALLKPLVRHWAATEPDLVVSLVPNFNRVLCESVATALPGVPYVTVMTDMADHPPHFWIEPGQDQWLVCGTARAEAQARAAGYPAHRVARTSGMLIQPAFYEAPKEDRNAARRRLGLDEHAPTAVVMFGGHGSRQMLRVAQLLESVQLVMLCGHNTALQQQLSAMKRWAPHVAVGFQSPVAPWLRLGDVFIGKPGPGCLSEAVHLGLPVITLRNAWTMPQERYNTEWVQETHVGEVVRSVSALPGALNRVVAQLDSYRAATQRVQNRAVFEVPALLASLLEGSSALTEHPPPASVPMPASHGLNGGYNAQRQRQSP